MLYFYAVILSEEDAVKSENILLRDLQGGASWIQTIPQVRFHFNRIQARLKNFAILAVFPQKIWWGQIETEVKIENKGLLTNYVLFRICPHPVYAPACMYFQYLESWYVLETL